VVVVVLDVDVVGVGAGAVVGGDGVVAEGPAGPESDGSDDAMVVLDAGPAPSNGPITATTTRAVVCSVLIRVIAPLRATGVPATIVVPPAFTDPAVTSTSAETSVSSSRASLVVSTSRTRSTSRTPSPGVNGLVPAPEAGEINVTAPPTGATA